MAGDEGSLGHALPCERIAWGDALFTKECIIRFHSEPYLGWDWRRAGASSGAAGDEGSVRVTPCRRSAARGSLLLARRAYRRAD